MTALCGGGASQMKPGFSRNVTLSATAISSMLINIPVLYAVPLAVLIQYIALDLQDLCSTDPPAQPTMTPTDWAALILPAWTPQNQEAIAKFTAWITYFLWFQFCECAAVSTPAPVLPAPPADVPTINPPSPGYPPVIQACATRTATGSLVNSVWTNIIHLMTIPVNATSVRITATNNTVGAGPHGNAAIAWAQYAPGSTVQMGAGLQNTVLNGTTFEIDVPVVSGAAVFDVSATPGAVANSNTVTVTIVVSCGGQIAGDPVQPCCPPDEATQQMLQQILSLVTIMQRQIVPFAYVPGASHTGLTGDGTFAVPHIVGLEINVTVLPVAVGHAGDDPVEYFDLGFVTLGTADGYDHSIRVDHEHQVHFPPRASLYTKVGYQLAAGATVTIRELLREP